MSHSKYAESSGDGVNAAAIFDQARDAVIIRDLEGTIAYWNTSAELLLGWSSSDAVGRCAQDFLCKDPVSFDDALSGVLAEGSWSGEICHLTKSGDEISLKSRWTMLSADGGVRRILTMASEVTNRPSQENQARHTQRLESVRAFASGIAHDLNNVFGPIIMAVDLFKLTLKSQHELDILETVEVSAQHGAEIVKQVLAVTKAIEEERTRHRAENILHDLGEAISEGRSKSLEIGIMPAEGLWRIFEDPIQTTRTLLEICLNARGAILGDALLTVSAANRLIDESFVEKHSGSRTGSFVAFEIASRLRPADGADDGAAAALHQPERKAESELSTLRAAVESRGGFLLVERPRQGGVVMRVYFPAVEDSPEDTGSGAAEPIPRGDGELILLIDDEASVRVITTQTLEAFGYNVLTACDGADGVAKYAGRRGKIAAVITDMVMPVMGGAAAINVLTQLDGEVKVIATSGLHLEATQLDTVQGSVKAFLRKPYTVRKLLKTVSEVIHPTPEPAEGE